MIQIRKNAPNKRIKIARKNRGPGPRLRSAVYAGNTRIEGLMTDIFLSYASEDRLKANVIVNLFSDVGWDVWWDRDISGGENWSPEILRKVSEAKCVVVLWSRDSVKKEWVQKEAEVALNNGTLVPVLLQPAMIETPTPSIQAIRLSVWTGHQTDDLKPLLDAVCGKIDGDEATDFENEDINLASSKSMREISRVEVAQVVFDYCAIALTHEILRQNEHRFSEDEFQSKRDCYDDLKACLAPEEGTVNEEDLHELMSRFMDVLHPEES